MVLDDPLADSYPNNYGETPNCHQNLDIIALKNYKELTPKTLVTLWPTLIPTNILKHQNVTKILRWLPWIFS